MAKKTITRTKKQESGDASMDDMGPPVGYAGEPEVSESDSDMDSEPNGKPRVLKVREVDEKAAKLKELRKLPKPPAYRLKSWPDIKSYLDLLTPEMWDHVQVYVYRTRPQIIRQQSNPNNLKYIDVFAEPFDIEDIIHRHGGGRYELQVKDNDKDNRICIGTADVSMNEHDPILDYRELDFSAKANAGYINSLVARGVIDSEGNPLASIKRGRHGQADEGGDINERLLDKLFQMNDRLAALTQSQRDNLKGQEGLEDQAISRAIDLASKGGDRVVEFMTKQAEEAGPAKTMGLITTIFTAIEKLTGDKKGGEASVLKDMLSMQQEHNKAMLELTREVANAKNADGGIDTLTKYLDLAERLTGRGGGKRPWYETLLEHGTPLVGQIASTIQTLVMAKNPGLAGMAPATNPAGMGQQAGAISEGQQGQVGQPGQTGQAQEGETAMPEQTEAQQAQMAQFIASQSYLVLASMNEGKTGDQLAEDIVSLYGMQTYQLIARVGKERLVGFLKATPEFWQQFSALYEEPKLVQFIEEFLRFPELLEAEQTKQQTENDTQGEG